MPNENYTTEELCETVFYLSRYAECMEIDKTITVPDESELFHMILDWAREFETGFDPDSGVDHQSELESSAPRWLRKTFPYDPELDGQRQAIIDFIKFEEETSVIWPWAASAGEMIQSDLRAVERAVQFDLQDNFDTDELYAALDRAFGVNPALSEQQPTEGMTGPAM